MSKKLVVKRASVVGLFKELGFKTADQWDSKKLMAKVKALPDITDGVKIRNPKVRKCLKAILEAKKIIIKSPDDKKEAATDKKAEKAVKASKKRTSGKKEGVKKTKGAGVVATILEVIQKKGPISKEGILKALKEKFPKRAASAMKNTISVQVPSRLNTEKNAKIKKDDKGRYRIKK